MDRLAGDRVFVHHPHQTEYVVPASFTQPLPVGVDPAVGTLLANLETAVNIVLDAAPRIGEMVVIYGQGVVGVLVAQILDSMGTVAVVRVEPDWDRLNLVEKLARGRILSTDEEALDHVMMVSGGRGADLAIECSGNPAALNAALGCLAPEGTVVVASWYGTKEASIDLGGTFHRNRLRVISSQVGRIGPELTARWDRSRRLCFASDLLSKLNLAPLITHRIPFKDAGKAYDLLQSSPGGVMQAVLTYGDADV